MVDVGATVILEFVPSEMTVRALGWHLAKRGKGDYASLVCEAVALYYLAQKTMAEGGRVVIINADEEETEFALGG